MRVRGELTEVRARDLRFTRHETTQFFTQVMKMDLSAEWIHSLEERTEGWVAGLQLAALSLQGRKDVPAFLEDFHGSHRYVIDYLMDEVLRNLPEEIREFLAQTSILKRFNAALCDAITGREDSQEILSQIEQSNLFLVPLDERREWYRYHQLFEDFLHIGLDEHSESSLHLRAAAWFESNGLLPEAIEHTLAGKDYPTASRLISLVANAMIGQGELSTLIRWIEALPPDALQENGDLMSLLAWCRYFTGGIEKAEVILNGLDETTYNRMSPLSQGRFESLRAWSANARMDARAIEYAQRALRLIGETNPIDRAVTLIVLGHGNRWEGMLPAAIEAYAEAVQLGMRAHAPLVTVNTLNSLSMAMNEFGQRREALALIQEKRKDLIGVRGKPLPVADLLCISESLLLYEGNELNEALKSAHCGREATQRFLSGRILGGEVERVISLSNAALGNYPAALEVIQEARHYGNMLSWFLPQMDALEAEIFLMRGDVSQAVQWAERTGFSPTDRPNYAMELSYFPFIRLLLVQDRLQEAKVILNNLEGSARQTRRYARLITILIFQALTEQKLGDQPSAVKYLEEALQRAAPGGYTQRFLNEGEAAQRLISDSAAQIRSRQTVEVGQFVEQVLAAFAEMTPIHREDDPVGGQVEQPLEKLADRGSQSSVEALIEPLSDQEIRILRMVAAGLSNQEIASELVISHGTVKWHVHNIYGKLGVSGRMQAAARAKELGVV
jgi:LuxR family transcriptional regulator, maltose regulon positive regulatory protein